MYDYAKKEGESFAVKYENVFNAIPVTVRRNVEQALDENPKLKEFLQGFQQTQINSVRARIIEKYNTLEEARIHKEEIIQEITHEERSNMEDKMSKQLAIDYISGMTDRGFNDLAIKLEYMRHTDINESKRLNTPSESVVELIEKNRKEREEEEQNQGVEER